MECCWHLSSTDIYLLCFIYRIPPSTKGFDNAFHKRPHVSRVLSSPDVQSDQPSVPHVSQNQLLNLASSEGMQFLNCLLYLFSVKILAVGEL